MTKGEESNVVWTKAQERTAIAAIAYICRLNGVLQERPSLKDVKEIYRLVKDNEFHLLKVDAKKLGYCLFALEVGWNKQKIFLHEHSYRAGTMYHPILTKNKFLPSS